MSGLRNLKRSMRRGLVAQVRAEAKEDKKPMPDEALANSIALSQRHTTLAGMGRRAKRALLNRIRNHLVLVPKSDDAIIAVGSEAENAKIVDGKAS